MAETTLPELLQHHQLFCAADAMTLPSDISPLPSAPCPLPPSTTQIPHPALSSCPASFISRVVHETCNEVYIKQNKIRDNARNNSEQLA
jgi:hypothetical protein